MWGAACDMDAIMEIAARRDLLVIEDACQGVGGSYQDGRRFGSIGHIGAFSFNYYKNMTARRGRRRRRSTTTGWPSGCAAPSTPATSTGTAATRRSRSPSNGARASELMGAMLNVQLDRLPGMIAAMHAEKKRVLAGTASARQPRAAADADEQPPTTTAPRR